MNLKPGSVISDLLGKSGMAIIKSIIFGNPTPTELAMLAEDNCKATKEEIAKSLEGTWSEDHLFELEQAYDLYNFIQGQIRQCDKQIEMTSSDTAHNLPLLLTIICHDARKRSGRRMLSNLTLRNMHSTFGK